MYAIYNKTASEPDGMVRPKKTSFGNSVRVRRVSGRCLELVLSEARAAETAVKAEKGATL
jgi:hypothetical protein